MRILLIDDEKDALDVLEWKLKTYVSNVEITTCSSPIQALDVISMTDPDIVFLDIHMPEMDGFTFLEKLPSRDFELIFTTALDDFAFRAIKENAVDYLLKPIDKIELITAVEKARNNVYKDNLAIKAEAILHSLKPTSPKINITADGKIYFLESKDVIMLQSDKSYTTVFLESDKK